MKAIKLLLVLAISALLASCAASGDPTWMSNAAAGIQGGIIESPSGAAMSPGLQNRNRAHPFFGGSQ